MKIYKNTYIYIGDSVNFTFNDIPDDFIISFYSKCEKLNFPLIFSSGNLKIKDNIIKKDTEIISNMFLILKDSTGANSIIPKGKYVISYANGDYGNTNYIYKNMFEFISKNKLKIIGNLYEEYLLDELAESNPNKFVMKIMVQVE